MGNKAIYTPIPTILLHGFLDETRRLNVINDIIYYALYYHTERLGGDYHRAHAILRIANNDEKAAYNKGKRIAEKVSSKSFGIITSYAANTNQDTKVP